MAFPNPFTGQNIGNILLGNALDYLGGKIGVPEKGISEFVAGGPTLNTSNPVYPSEKTPTEPKTTGTITGTDGYADPVEDMKKMVSDKVAGEQTSSPQQTQTSNVNDFDTVYNAKYPGWGKQEAYNDWVAKGRPGLTSDAGQLSNEQNKYNQFVSANPYSDITPGWNPDDFQSQLDEIYNASMDFANKREQSLRQMQSQNVADIGQTFDTTKGGLETSKQQTLGQLGETEIGSRQREEQAITAANRLYNELTRGYEQQFGGASSAGEVAKALASRELQRTQGGARQATQNALRQIAVEKSNVEQNYQQKIVELNTQKQSAITQANQQLQQGLDTIDQDRTVATQEKAMAKMNLIKEYRTSLFNIQQQVKSYEANIQAMKEQAQLQLDAIAKQNAMAAQSGQGAYDSLLDEINLNPDSNLVFGTGAQSGQQLTGVKDDDYMNFLRGARSYSPTTDEGQAQSLFGTNALFR